MLVLFYTANIYNPLQLSKQWAELFVADAIIMDFVGGLFDLSNPSMKKIEKKSRTSIEAIVAAICASCN